MRSEKSLSWAGRAALGIALLAFCCPVEAGAFDGVSLTRGGRLYDNWIVENKDRPPTEIHPQFIPGRPSMHDTENSWRCVSCHGWDYSGVTAQRTGPLAAEYRPSVAQLTALLQGPTHGYQGKLSNRDLVDLSAFLADGRVDMSAHIEQDTGISRGNPAREQNLYDTVCLNCHGGDGKRLAEIEPLGVTSRKNPQKALHTILNGHPGVRMPPMRIISLDRLGNLLAYLQTLPDLQLAASVTRGGRLYDNWQKEKDAPEQTFRHPAYPLTGAQAKLPSTNWRCKECHGWDYKGRDGAYGEGAHFTGIVGIRAQAGASPDDLRNLLMDENHQYHGTRWTGSLLNQRDLTDLANFVAAGQVDMDSFIDPKTKKANGQAADGKEKYDVFCATCHGIDGHALATGFDIGDLARANPWETLHKIRNGHPGETMPGLQGVLEDRALVNILAHTQTLP
ncbi:hypothetical protein JCM17960_23540 [Magnetospira thiophila]